MKRAIREHLRDFIAIGGLIVLAALTAGVILSQQRLKLPDWVPVLGSDRFELKAEMSTAQAVTPGQGQTVNIDGIKVGDIEQGRPGQRQGRGDDAARQQVRRPDPHRRLVPAAAADGLQDMTLDLDPGSPDKPTVPDGFTVSERQHGSQRPARRDPRFARRRHAGLPQAPRQRRRRGSGRQARQELCGRPEAAHSARSGSGEDQRRPRQAPQERRPLDHDLQARLWRARHQRLPPRRLRDELQRGPRLLRQGAGLAARLASRSCRRRCARLARRWHPASASRTPSARRRPR